MNWTKEQREAIEVRDKNILVSAAAGSGKTAVLVERIKQLILSENVKLEEMLVVTFTNAAASEMREKIVSAIPEQMDRIHKSHISTFHAFALDVIKRYFHLINIEPNFKICDDTQRIILQGEAMEELFRIKFQEEDPDFLHFLKLYAGSKNEDPVKEMILLLHTFIQSIPHPFQWLDEKKEALCASAEEFITSKAFAEILLRIDEELSLSEAGFEKVLSIVESAGLESLIPKAKADLQKINDIQAAFGMSFEAGAQLLREAKFATFSAGKEDKELYQDIKEDIQILRDGAKDNIKRLVNLYCAKPLSEYIDEINSTYKETNTLCSLVKEFDELYRKRKEKKGVIDFSDIEHYALEILSVPLAASEYREKFRYIFIDEYQDSNLIQECIISKIQRENNVFMVGDVKQSIYKFRLAEPEIFIDKYEKFRKSTSPYDIKLDLNRNFRSKGNIIELVNDVFSQVMNKRTAGMDYDKDAALYKGIEYEGCLDYPVELHLSDDRQIDAELYDEIMEMKKAELEAFTAAQLVKASVGLPYFDTKTGKERKLCNKDIVILLRSTSNIAGFYYDALEKEGIPVYMDMGDGFFDTVEISVFLNLLKIIDNKKQDIPLLSVLRSPVFGFTIEQLAYIRRHRKKGAFYDAFISYIKEGQDRVLKDKCSYTSEKIKYYKKRSLFLPLPDFIWELLQDTGYYNYAGALPGGTQRQANLRALADKAAVYNSIQSKGLFGFINYIEAVKKEKVATAPVKLLGESDDVVRIMTVHKSKGLEFPMVLAGNLGRAFYRESGGQVTFHKDLGLALKQVDRENSCCRRTILQNIIDSIKSREALAEEIRILYVTLTRPMDKLILLGSVSDGETVLRTASIKRELGISKGKSYLDFLLPALSGSKKVLCKVHDREGIGYLKKEQREHKNKLLYDLKSGFDVNKDIAKEIESRLSWQYGYQRASETKSKYSVTELSLPASAALPASTALAAPLRLTQGRKISESANRGIIYHKVMQYIPFGKGKYDSDEIESFIEGMIKKEIITRDEANLIDISRIIQFFDSAIGKRACGADEVFREVSFNLLKKQDGEEIIIQGTIDCYFKEYGKFVLLDYKSNYVTEEEGSAEALGERYRPQIELYKEALEQIRGIEVKEMYLYLFAIGKEIKL